MKVNYSLLLTACVLLLMVAGFFYLHRTCSELADKHEVLSAKQVESTKIAHLPKLIQASDEFQSLVREQNNLQEEIEYLRQQIDLLQDSLASPKTNTQGENFDVNTFRPVSNVPLLRDQEADICRQEEAMRNKILKKMVRK